MGHSLFSRSGCLLFAALTLREHSQHSILLKFTTRLDEGKIKAEALKEILVLGGSGIIAPFLILNHMNGEARK